MVYNIENQNQNSKNHQFDEQLRLISSPNKELAFQKALRIGTENQSFIINQKNETITWKFIGVGDIVQVQEFKDGMEMYSFTTESAKNEDYEQYILKKNDYFKTLSGLQTLQLI